MKILTAARRRGYGENTMPFKLSVKVRETVLEKYIVLNCRSELRGNKILALVPKSNRLYQGYKVTHRDS